MKNSAEGGCYPQRSKAEVDNTLRDLQNSSHHILRKSNSIIALLFIQSIFAISLSFFRSLKIT